MTAEQAQQLSAFNKEIATLDGDVLLKRWIEFENSDESKEPDLGLMKSLALESRLQAVFGVMWKQDTKAQQEALRAQRP